MNMESAFDQNITMLLMFVCRKEPEEVTNNRNTMYKTLPLDTVPQIDSETLLKQLQLQETSTENRYCI